MKDAAFFAGHPTAKRIYRAVLAELSTVGPATPRVTKSQIAFRRQRAFAWVWMPGMYLRGKSAPLVLSLSLPAKDRSKRWKEIVEPKPGRFMHHLELHAPSDVDAQVRKWLRKSWEAAA